MHHTNNRALIATRGNISKPPLGRGRPVCSNSRRHVRLRFPDGDGAASLP